VSDPVVIVPRFEPQPFFGFLRERVFIAAFWRPRDLCFGVQFMLGGLMLHLWPISVAIVDPRKARA
jgi:hypothetical protein